jgi:exonuclease SbcC
MSLQLITLTNFKKHKNLQVELKHGFNMICGENYAGKSTVLHAILVALFGPMGVKGSISDLTTTGEASYRLVLSGVSNGKTWVINRTPKACTITQEGKELALGHTACNSWIEENILQTDRASYLTNSYSGQGNAQALLGMEGAQLIKYVEKQLGIERLEEAVRLCNKQVTENKAILDVVEALQPEHRQSLQQKLSNYTADKGAIEGQAEKVKKALEEDQAELKVLKNSVNQGALYQQKWSDYTARVATAKKALQESAEIPDVDEAWLKEQERANDLQALVNRLEKIAIPDFPEVDESVVEKKAQITEELKTVKVALAQAKKSVTDGVCSLCGTVLSDDPEHLKEELDKVQQRYEKVTIRAEGIFKEFRVYEKNKHVYKQAEAELVLRSDVEQQIKEFGEAPAVVLSRQEIKLKRQELANALAKHEQLKERALEVQPECENVTTQALQLLKGSMEQVEKAAEGKNTYIVDAQVKLVGLSKDIESITLELGRDDKAKKRQEKANAVLKNAGKVSDVMSSVRERVVKQAWNQVMFACESFVKEVTDGFIDQVFMDGGVIKYSEAGEVRAAAVCASGAQKTLIGLGLKLGIFQVAGKDVDFFLLDEPTADMTVEVSSRCMLSLAKALPSVQVVVVTHRTEDTADNVILIEE